MKGKTTEEKIRLLEVIPALDIGGAQVFLVELVKGLDKNIYEVGVCLLNGRQNTFLENELEKNNIPLFPLNLRWAFCPKTIKRLFKLFSNFKPHIIHTHLRAIRYVLIPSRKVKIPLHIHTIHSLAKQDTSIFYRWLNRIAFQRLGVVPVSISQEVAKTVKEVYGVDSPVIYNGISVEDYTYGTPRERTAEEIRLINVGKFKKAKNHLLLIEAFSRAARINPNLRLILVGDGRLRKKAEKRVNELGLEGKVSFLGWRSDIPKLLADCDIFVLSSDWEGFGIVLIEAMSAGKPVIATRVGGVPEVVDEGETGILVPPRDPDALAGAILKLAEDGRLREEMGRKGREKAMREFHISKAIQNYDRLYREMLGRGLWEGKF
ncbi:glycosyltransferase [bacterium]|nr:glycosyltransferase [bacterium]